MRQRVRHESRPVLCASTRARRSASVAPRRAARSIVVDQVHITHCVVVQRYARAKEVASHSLTYPYIPYGRYPRRTRSQKRVWRPARPQSHHWTQLWTRRVDVFVRWQASSARRWRHSFLLLCACFSWPYAQSRYDSEVLVRSRRMRLVPRDLEWFALR